MTYVVCNNFMRVSGPCKGKGRRVGGSERYSTLRSAGSYPRCDESALTSLQPKSLLEQT